MPVVLEFNRENPAPTISASRITSYLLCPLKYRFTYVDKIPRPWKSAAFAFGSAVHSALEAWQSSRLSGEEMAESEVVKLFLVDWEAEKAGGIRFKTNDDETTLAEKGQALLTLAMQTLKPDPPQAVELPFEIDLVDPETREATGLRLRGVFDLILLNDRLVEIKTAARRWDEFMLETNLQLTAYHLAYETLMKRTPVLEVVTLLKTKKPEVQVLRAGRTKEDTAWFTRLCLTVYRGITTKIFYPNPNHLCSDCEFAGNCREWRG